MPNITDYCIIIYIYIFKVITLSSVRVISVNLVININYLSLNLGLGCFHGIKSSDNGNLAFIFILKSTLKLKLLIYGY